jgi:general secretion pathway protein G
MKPAASPALKRAGFTLLELIVVITIIGILATLVVVRTTGITPKARIMKAKNDLIQILNVAKMMHAETGRYPESIEEMVNPKDENGQDLMGGLEKYPKDPWNNDYGYDLVNSKPQAKCLGSDKTEGGEGEAADIIMGEGAEEETR